MNAERQMRRAWRVLLLCALCFTLIVSALGAGYATYRSNATRPQSASVSSFLAGGQAQVRGRQRADWSDVTVGANLSEGDTVRTGDDTRMRITLFDGTLIELYEKTVVTFGQLRASQYLDRNAIIELRQDSGHLVVTTSRDSAYARTRVQVLAHGAAIEAQQRGTGFRVLIVPGLGNEQDRIDVS